MLSLRELLDSEILLDAAPRVLGFAAMRDASWYNSPGRARRYHVAVDHLGLCGGPYAACGAGPLLVEQTELSLVRVPDVLRCRRHGCASRWP